MAVHAHLKNEFTEDEKYISWDGYLFNKKFNHTFENLVEIKDL